MVHAGDPSAGGSHPGLWPVTDESVEFWTLKRKAVKTQAGEDLPH